MPDPLAGTPTIVGLTKDCQKSEIYKTEIGCAVTTEDKRQMAYTFTWEPRGIHARFYGVYAVTELMETFIQISRAPVSIEVSYAILDYTAVESQSFTEMDALNVVAFDIGLSRLMPKLRLAVLVHEGHALEAWRMFMCHHPIPERYEVFQSLSGVRSWMEDICLPSPAGTLA